MGLDVILVEHAKLVVKREDVKKLSEEEVDAIADRAVVAYQMEGFMGREDGWPLGYYEGESRRVVSWSYGGYGHFRKQVCRAVHDCEPEAIWKRVTDEEEGIMDLPLVLLIDFADNEGFFGPVTSARLGAEMMAAETDFYAYVGDDWEGQDDRRRYSMLRAAFQAAGETGGIVCWR